ncbi:MAG: metal-dependent transcriptional regulator [Clostridia bacterium]|nr:metal-dependent transcriptional regulator [Clostridia bacterium]
MEKFIKESGEMYLETILVLTKKLGFVRSVDIVNETGHSKSSVSKAVNILKSNGFISVAKDGGITFTKMGEDHAKEIYERHHVLKDFLIKLGVTEETAEIDACRVEHVISKETVDKIKEKLKEL